MGKIKTEGLVAEPNGDEMTRVIWKEIRERPILPYLDINLDYCDLGIQNRDATDFIKLHHVGVKCATVIPDEARVKEFGLRKSAEVPRRHHSQYSRRHDFP
ncbi:hypothetical protein [Bifidobacterium bohemicum]|uniref:hypothetical protein n=1 Tax=Bifidobacterium bohemicum TaxID=638617 RepID=UPI000A93BE89